MPVNARDLRQSIAQDRPEKLPAHEMVYRQLRDHILFGEVAPGEAVTIQGLTESLGAGMTPVREAIRRLTSEGALQFQGNRRVSVPVLSAAALEEIGYLRKAVEPELARKATPYIQTEQITLLREADAQIDGAIRQGDVKRYLAGNYRFHMIMYGQARAPVLLGVAQQLWLRFGPSLRVVCGRFGTQNLPDRHKDILQSFEGRDAKAVFRATLEDVSQGMSQMLQVLEGDS